jgi:hypothetical protein
MPRSAFGLKMSPVADSQTMFGFVGWIRMRRI